MKNAKVVKRFRPCRLKLPWFSAYASLGKTSSMHQRDRNGVLDESGATAIEYGLIAAMMTTALIGALLNMNAIVEALYSIVTVIQDAL